MASTRKGLSKKLRFEVFKRDKFTCQYCGKKAPDVVLQCDHVEPVVEGGPNTLLNLITSCVECNAGKGARRLDDESALAKQRMELERLSERREQIDMMLAWHNEVSDTAEYEIDSVAAHWAAKVAPYALTPTGRDDLRKWLRKFSLSDVLAAMDTAVSQYGTRDNEGNLELTSVNLAWSKVPGIARISKLPQAEKDLYYIRGILRRRLLYLPEDACMDLLRDAHAEGLDIEWMKEKARRVGSWSAFRDAIYEATDDRESDARA